MPSETPGRYKPNKPQWATTSRSRLSPGRVCLLISCYSVVCYCVYRALIKPLPDANHNAMVANKVVSHAEVPVSSTQDAVSFSDPIASTLHMIVAIANPTNCEHRVALARRTIDHLERYGRHITVYVVELAYGQQSFSLTSADNARHLQLRTMSPLWHKENLINLAVRYLLPQDWAAVAWVDAEVEFDGNGWAVDALKILNGYKDIVQLFSHCVVMGQGGHASNVEHAFGYLWETEKGTKGHPGYSWACTRRAYEQMGGLYEYAIVGGGDYILGMSLIERSFHSVPRRPSPGFMTSLKDFEMRLKGLRIGYVPGVIRHNYHGERRPRKYVDRWDILMNSTYDPRVHLTHDERGVLIPTSSCPKQMLAGVEEYFKSRSEAGV